MQTESFESLLQEYGFFEEELLKERTIAELPVVSIGSKFVGVDLNSKSEGFIPLEQFRKNKKEGITLNIGDVIPVFIETFDNGYGQPVLSYEKAIQEISKSNLIESHKSKDKFVEVVGSHMTNAGIVCNYNGIEVFVPFTLCYIENLPKSVIEQQLIGNTFKVKVIKTDFEKNHILASHRLFLESENGLSFDNLSDKLTVGKVYEATVKALQPFGAFIGLNGIDTLLRINDIGWTNLENINDHIKIGQTVNVMLTGIDKEKERVFVSHKLANLEPWNDFFNNNNQGDVIEARVITIKDDFVIVRFDDKIDFIVYQDEIADTNIRGKLYHFFELNEVIKTKIKSIDKDTKKVVLSVKSLESNVNNLEKLVGNTIEAKVISILPNGIKVMHENDVIFISKFHLTENYDNDTVLNSLKEGQILQVKVVKYKDNVVGTLVLGETVLDKVSQYKKGSKIKNIKVLKINKQNAEVETEDGVRGYLTVVSNVKIDIKDVFEEGQLIEEATYKSFDKNNYMHLEVDMSFNNSYQNPTIGDVVN